MRSRAAAAARRWGRSSGRAAGDPRPMARNPQHSLPVALREGRHAARGRRGRRRGEATTQRANGSSDRDLQAAAAVAVVPAPTDQRLLNAQRGIVGGGGMQIANAAAAGGRLAAGREPPR